MDLANFLNKMGAKIEGHGTRRVEVEGVDALRKVRTARFEVGIDVARQRGERSAFERRLAKVQPVDVRVLDQHLLETRVGVNET